MLERFQKRLNSHVHCFTDKHATLGVRAIAYHLTLESALEDKASRLSPRQPTRKLFRTNAACLAILAGKLDILIWNVDLISSIH